MLKRPRTSLTASSIAAIAVCGALACLASLFLRADSIGSLLPLLFLLVLIPIAHLWGPLTGVLAAIASGIAFAVILFPPYGSLIVQDIGDRMNLASFELVATGVAYLSSKASVKQ